MVYIPIYIWLIFMINVGKYTIHGSYGYGCMISCGGKFHLTINSSDTHTPLKISMEHK